MDVNLLSANFYFKQDQQKYFTMNRHVFERKQVLPISLDQAWSFFSDPRNLSRITPPSMDFKIISSVPENIFEGLQVEYTVKPLLGIPIKWVSLIEGVKAPYEFVDLQLQGPYRYWHHWHRFSEVSGGILMEDIIDYEIPMDWLLPWLNKNLVIKQLNGIFEYRRKILTELF